MKLRLLTPALLIACDGLQCAQACAATKVTTPGIQASNVAVKKRPSFLQHCTTNRDRRLSHSVVHSTPAGNDDTESTPQRWPAITKAALLIAGTTIGGGFLALPQTVVALGGFPVTAVSLSVVWSFLLAQSWILCRSIVQCHQETGRDGIGITYLAQHVLGAGRLTLFLLVVLTEATLVSQVARAGILFAAGASSMAKYQIGCSLAAVTGGILSLGSSKIAANSNALLTTIFLGAAALLFQAGQAQADWSNCLVSTSTVSLATVAKAIPTMLQLLVYGEILPNVCRMLNYKLADISTALAFGSFLPLVLLSGWAALGVSLLPTLSASIDPVTILLQNSNTAVQSSLTILAIAAISTTILGSFLALQSAYNDVASESGKEWLQRPAVSTLTLVGPPLGISLISPSLFFKAIDFAGAYPVLLLFGVLPPLISYRMKGSDEKKVTWSMALGLLSAGMVSLATVKDGTSIVVKFLSFVAICTSPRHEMKCRRRVQLRAQSKYSKSS